jgi:hypothetical protein
MDTHWITYDGIEFKVVGEYEQPEEETGYKGGWSTEAVYIEDVNVYDMLNNYTLSMIGRMVVEENY